MELSRRKYLGRIAIWTLGWNAAQLVSPNLRAYSCIEDTNGFEAEFPSMGSKINLRWYNNSATSSHVVEAAEKVADQWVKVLSDYDPTSQSTLACLKADLGNWTPLSEELWSVVEMCDQWHRWSNGAFDAALGAITRLRRQRKQVSADRWDEARRKSGWRLIELDSCNQAIRFATPGVRFDFGAIGKGVVVDRIAAKLQEMEIERYVVNSSGNMRIGTPPQGTEGWPIAIDVSFGDSTRMANELLRMRLSRCGIATSGDRWQRFPDRPRAEKNEYSSHILDPKTNEGITGNQSVTIIAENATDADAAATATCVRAGRDLAGWLQNLAENKPKSRAMVLIRDEAAGAVRMISTVEFDSRSTIE